MTTAFCKQTHTHFQRRPGCSSLYIKWFSLGSPHTVCVVGMFHRYIVSGTHNHAFASKVAQLKSVFMLMCRLIRNNTAV